MKPGYRTLLAISAAILVGGSIGVWTGNLQAQLTPLSELPITTRTDEIGDLLRKWYSHNTAAGNTGDYYDNRDGGHSPLNMAPYPQLHKIEYSEQEIKSRENYGMQRRILPNVVFGNSSTSAPPESSGSNIRSFYVQPRGLEFLFMEYGRNNLYIYPEHRDHDPGHNGIEGYGDLFPTNTPFLIASQGSSGSDQPFMQAMALTLAAFRPDVKKTLVQTGMLMPAIQMILRITGSQLANEKEYLTGKAHPTVFDGSKINLSAMLEMAHGITLSTLPPIAILRVKDEETPAPGVDYFEPEYTEKLGDTPVVQARVFRGSRGLRKIVVSAEGSKDLNNRPLKYIWTILRGDPQKIKIEYLNAAKSAAAITVSYHDRRPVADDSSLESNRVDIGVFVHNGAYYSPPSFITFFTLDNESRTYGPGGNPIEIAYGVGTSTLSIADWTRFFSLFSPSADSWREQLIRRQFTPEETAELQKVQQEYQGVHANLLRAQEALSSQEKGDKDPALATKLGTLRESESRILQNERKYVKSGPAGLVQKVLNSILQDPDFLNANLKSILTLFESAPNQSRDAVQQVLEKLVRFGIAKKLDGSGLRISVLKRGRDVPAEPLTRYERNMIERLNAVLLSRIVFPGIMGSTWTENYVDSRLVSDKEWRDIYHYSPDGTLLGWTRYDGAGIMEFNADGMLILKRDSQGRCIRARSVRYEVEPQQSGIQRKKLKLIQTDMTRDYQYDGQNDWKGHVKS